MLDPAIHVADKSAWTTGSSPVVTKNGRPALLKEGNGSPRPSVEARTDCAGIERESAPSGRITDILNGRRSVSADTAVRLGRYLGNSARFWLDLEGQFDIATVERERRSLFVLDAHANVVYRH